MVVAGETLSTSQPISHVPIHFIVNEVDGVLHGCGASSGGRGSKFPQAGRTIRVAHLALSNLESLTGHTYGLVCYFIHLSN